MALLSGSKSKSAALGPEPDEGQVPCRRASRPQAEAGVGQQGQRRASPGGLLGTGLGQHVQRVPGPLGWMEDQLVQGTAPEGDLVTPSSPEGSRPGPGAHGSASFFPCT